MFADQISGIFVFCFFFGLSLDGQDAVADGDVKVIFIDPGHRELHGVGIFGLFHIHAG